MARRSRTSRTSPTSHANRGMGWQDIVEATIENLPGSSVSKTDPCFKILQNLGRGRFKVQIIRRGRLDFEGGWYGWSVGVDAKETKSASITQGKITPEQRARLAKMTETLCIAGLIVRFKRARASDDEMFAVPWWVCEERKTRHGSIQLAHLYQAHADGDPVRDLKYTVKGGVVLLKGLDLWLEDCRRWCERRVQGLVQPGTK